ncbi:MAG: hypothetical protein LUD77_03530 [Clostridiales bacterium]|nr:hypothetical protein [Clostridiales bacterium]
MYRKRRMTYIVVFIFLPCIIVPLIYLTVYFNDFKSKAFREISFTAETEEGESYNLRAKYDKDELLYEVSIPMGISISNIIVNTQERGVFEINDIIFENGDAFDEIQYDTEYDIKMYTEDSKLLNEASLVFRQDTENMLFSYNTDNENVNIVSTAEEDGLPDPEGMDGLRQMMRREGRRGLGNRPFPVYTFGLGCVFALCCIYLLYRQVKISGILKKVGRRNEHNT